MQVAAFTTSMLEAAVSPEVGPQQRMLAMLYFKNNVARCAVRFCLVDPRGVREKTRAVVTRAARTEYMTLHLGLCRYWRGMYCKRITDEEKLHVRGRLLQVFPELENASAIHAAEVTSFSHWTLQTLTSSLPVTIGICDHFSIGHRGGKSRATSGASGSASSLWPVG